MTNLTILITGFGPFPGAPYNPTAQLVARLMRLRRPALADVALAAHVFEVTYDAVDRDLPQLLERHRPRALLMFGLAARTRHIRIETRARNTITTLWPAADHENADVMSIAGSCAATLRFGSHTHQILRAVQDTRAFVKPSRDAGRYLCNYLCWRAIEATPAHDLRAAAFVHVPAVPRGTPMRRPSKRPRVSFEQLVDAGEAALMTMIRLARRK